MVIACDDKGSTQAITIGIDTSALLGDYELYVVVDRGDEILELEDINNASPVTALTVLPDTPDAPVVIEAAFDFNSHSLRYRFSKDVSASLAVGDLSLANLTTGQIFAGVNAATDVSWESATRTATFRLLHALPDGHYLARLSSDGVTDPMGRALDGDGDGAAGGDHLLAFFILLGDFNRDRVVNHDDFLIQYANFGAAGKTPSQGDVDYDGGVDFGDYQRFGLRFGNALPALAPAASAVTARARSHAPVRASAPRKRGVTITAVRTTSTSRFATKAISPPRTTASLLVPDVAVRKLKRINTVGLFR